MDRSEDKPVRDVEALLDELEREEVPAMTADFEARAMDRIAARKQELDEEEGAVPKGRAGRNGWKAWIAVAAVFVFLLGGTLLTRGSLRDPYNPGNVGVLQPLSAPDGDKPSAGAEEYREPSELALFFEDMGLFAKAALPWVGGAAVLGAAVFLVVRLQKKKQ